MKPVGSRLGRSSSIVVRSRRKRAEILCGARHHGCIFHNFKKLSGCTGNTAYFTRVSLLTAASSDPTVSLDEPTIYRTFETRVYPQEERIHCKGKAVGNGGVCLIYKRVHVCRWFYQSSFHCHLEGPILQMISTATE